MARKMTRKWGTVWAHKAGRFVVTLTVERDYHYRYDGDDENGETQSALDSGRLVAFTSTVEVTLDGEVIGADSLYGSVYSPDTVADFWTAHRGADPLDRNCSVMRAARGENVHVCHYFPDMVRTAIADARDHVRSLPSVPYVRNNA